MRKFKYIGDCASGFVVMHGVQFDKGKATVAPGSAIQKLENNPFFEEAKPRKPKVEAEHDEDGA